MVAIPYAPHRPTILVALVAALGLAGAARIGRHHCRHHETRETVSLRAAHARCHAGRIGPTDTQKLHDIQTRLESGRTPDDNPPRADR